jgi:hypothetical protein
MKFNRIFLTYIFIFAALLLLSYYLASKTKNFELLWGRIKKEDRPMYLISVLLCAVSFILFLYYVFIKSDFTQEQITIIFTLCLLIIFLSKFWTLFSFQYLENKKPLWKYATKFVLLMIPITIITLLYNVYKINDKKDLSILKLFVMVGLVYFLLHTFFLDFILWSRNFFD